MRTTLNLDDALARAARERALAEGTTLTALVENGLRQLLREPTQAPATEPTLPTWGTAGGRPVSLEQIRETLDDDRPADAAV